MKHLALISIYLLVVFLSVLSVDSYARANFKVAVFNMQEAIQTVKEGKRARDTLKKKWEKTQKSLKAKEAKIQKAMEEFKKQSLVMDEKARHKKEMDIRTQMAQLQQEGMKAQREFQKQDQNLSRPILDRLRKIVATVSEKRGYAMVLDSNENSVLYFKKANEITKEVIKAYDSRSK